MDVIRNDEYERQWVRPFYRRSKVRNSNFDIYNTTPPAPVAFPIECHDGFSVRVEPGRFNVFHRDLAPHTSPGFDRLVEALPGRVTCAGWTGTIPFQDDSSVYEGRIERRRVPWDFISAWFAPGTNNDVTFLFKGFDRDGDEVARQVETISSHTPRQIFFRGFQDITKFTLEEDASSSPTVDPGAGLTRPDGLGVKNVGVMDMKIRSVAFPAAPVNAGDPCPVDE